MNYLLHYDEKMTKVKGENNKIVSGGKLKVNTSVNLLKLLTANDSLSLLIMSLEELKRVKHTRQFLNFM